jgi:hypothetical protein
LHDAAYQVYRGNLTRFAVVGNGACQWYDYLGVLRAGATIRGQLRILAKSITDSSLKSITNLQ